MFAKMAAPMKPSFDSRWHPALLKTWAEHCQKKTPTPVASTTTSNTNETTVNQSGIQQFKDTDGFIRSDSETPKPIGCRHIKPSAVSAVSTKQFKSAAVFEQIQHEINKSGTDYVKKMNGVFCFKVKKDNEEAVWVVDMKNGSGSIKTDPAGKGDVTITIGDDDLVKLMFGQLNPQQAFLQGKLKLTGNIGLAMKLKELQLKSGRSKL